MSESKTPISGAHSYADIGEFWDEHDLSEHWEKTRPVDVEVELRSSIVYVPLDRTLAEKLRSAARDHGISPQELLNLWIEQRMTEESRRR